ncbi:MAG: phosphodiester glycosidase family protein [bacterium]|nr:phosphodiester glycosidase family protein [bacterium]
MNRGLSRNFGYPRSGCAICLILLSFSIFIPFGKAEGEGIEHRTYIRHTPQGPVRANVLQIDLNDPRFYLKPTLAKEKISGLERISDMAGRLGAVAGINGTYFDFSGDPLGMLMIDGVMVSEPILNRTVFGITNEKDVLWRNLDFNARFVLKSIGLYLPIDGINRRRASKEETILYTRHYGERTGTKDHPYEIVVIQDHIFSLGQGNAYIPEEDGYVVSIGQHNDLPEERLRIWDEVELDVGLEGGWKEVVQAISGGPRLVKNGRVYITSGQEMIRGDIRLFRAPRSAIGVTSDHKLLLVGVDGRQKKSVGMTLYELASFLVELGAENAMNLDGGGSTTLFYNDLVINSPSDGVERPVSNGLFVFKSNRPFQ